MEENKNPEFYQQYSPKNRLRFVTATALFDGHDASINIMRRLIQARGGEVIHLGHNRTALEIARAAIEEDAHAIAVSSYQGGHVEFFKYLRQLLNDAGGTEIRIFGGGGGVIVPREIEDLEKHGITKIYSPEDGQILGLSGIIGHMLVKSDYQITSNSFRASVDPRIRISRTLTLLEGGALGVDAALKEIEKIKSHKPLAKTSQRAPIIGVTGSGGAGKSSLTDELIARFLWDDPNVQIAVLCVDPSKRKTGGALLGDRIRMNSASNERVFIRSFATRGSGNELAQVSADAVKIMQAAGFDLIIVETSGIGQGDAQILKMSDISLYVMTSEYGAASQLEKIDMLDFADLIAINKFERPQAIDAIRDVRTTLRRNRFQGRNVSLGEYPVFGTIASRFADDGVNGLFAALVGKINAFCKTERFKISKDRPCAQESTNRNALIPGDRKNYLGEIAKTVRNYHKNTEDSVKMVSLAEAFDRVIEKGGPWSEGVKKELSEKSEKSWSSVDSGHRDLLRRWPDMWHSYHAEHFSYVVRGETVKVPTHTESLSHLKIPKVSLPRFSSQADILSYLLKENVPGSFPYTGGVFPFRRQGEDPQRMFAGEGGPLRTNKRFKFLSKDSAAKRLSTAFDSVTLYGSDPHKRPDIYGKVGESGVSIATLDDMKDLFRGFDLTSPLTSVSMTINGPAPIILAFFMNAAIDQRIDKFVSKNQRSPLDAELKDIIEQTLHVVRGTVQADILKEDQAQNTCIFSTEFALKMMGDIQEFFINHKVRNYYSVSISGYHIAEAGANPITQLALTLANGFTYVEYYRARGMKIDDFAPNLSFFFSNGIDPEYAVLGRVARRIWAIAMRDLYGASARSQQLKYHIQTSGRSLHAQEIDFNDIRTTLQALMALYDNCNSLHTNAYDEAITTPTEDSVRRALAIQMIINREFGPNKSENINQGSFFLSELTDLVEEAVLSEFDRISERGGVLGAMEMQYQRNKIQEESLYYESLKDSGELPIIGVNTFINPKHLEAGAHARPEVELIRASYEEKDEQIHRLTAFKERNAAQSKQALEKLARAVMSGDNIFAALMEVTRFASLGEISETLYRVGGQYRRAM